jgi:hypothetical protein
LLVSGLLVSGLLVSGLLVSGLLAAPTPTDSIRATAVVDLNFDEKTGPAVDTASAGQADNSARLLQGARRVPSPFPGNGRGRAVLLEAARKQLIQIPSSPDVSRRDAVSIAMLLVNFHGPTDAATHGLFAKRSDDKTGHSNYGLNFNPKRKLLQLYVNDGSGFRLIHYNVADVLGTRRRIHLVATLQVGDAPGSDKDTDADDLLVRLFVNGKPATRTGQPDRSLADGDDIWLLDLKTTALQNSAPLCLGASTPSIEHFSGVLDEFQLFDRALTASEAARLFVEVAGPNAQHRFDHDRQPAAKLPAAPQLETVSLRGLQIGQTTRLVLTGKNLGPDPQLLAPFQWDLAKAVDGSNANRLTLDITLAKDARSGLYPLRIATAGGLSNPLTLAVDHLPQRLVADVTRANASQLPVAVSGLISASEISRCYVQAKAGQRLVADVEARRIGARCEPVLEIRNARGTPLAIEWSKVTLKGDTRVEITVPEDGIYSIEIHDLTYNAPGKSPFRVKIGDLALVDTVFPPAAVAGSEIRVTLVGSGLDHGTTLAVDLRNALLQTGTLVNLAPNTNLLGPAPVLRISRGREAVENDKPGTVLDARFKDTTTAPLTISGRLEQPGEIDRHLLDVSPGQKLRLSVSGRAIDSPIDAELKVLIAGKTVATSQDRAGSRDPQLDVTVPDMVTRIEVTVGDLYHRGGSHFLYRLAANPIGRPDFSLSLLTPQLNLPRIGTGLIRLQVNRAGYNGPIRLTTDGDSRIRLEPTTIPKGVAGIVAITVTRSNPSDDADDAVSNGGALRSLSLVGESIGIQPELRRNARVARQGVPGHEDLLPVGLTQPSGATLSVVSTPVALYRGLPAHITVVARGQLPNSRTGQAARIASISNEPPRPIDAKNRGKGNRPIVTVLPNQAVTVDGAPASITLAVPVDVPANSIEFVLQGGLLAHGYATAVQGLIHSRPFQLPVKNAVTVTLDPKTTTLANNAVNQVRGTLTRDPGFHGAVELEITIDKRLTGFQGNRITVPAGETAFTIPITSGQDNEARVLPGVQLIVKAANGGPLLPNRILKLRSQPPKAQPKTKPKTKPAGQ